jgi:hypothetical protein
MAKGGALQLATAAAILLGSAAPLWSQELFSVRGTLQAVEAAGVVVATFDGDLLDLPLQEDSLLFVVTPASLGDIDAGDFLGVTSIEADDGRRVALEAHLFAEELRGVGEGHYPWDLVDQPNTMTNATVAEITGQGRQRAVRMVWSSEEEGSAAGGEEVIHLPPNVPVVHLRPAPDRAALVPGKEVFVMVEGGPDDALRVTALVVGEGGAVPPM